tara:strand:- start:240 stop:410 length:171 start_codon:yes stop_codon:yes gene_type:complete
LPVLFFSAAGAIEQGRKDYLSLIKETEGRKAARIVFLIKKGMRPQGQRRTNQPTQA